MVESFLQALATIGIILLFGYIENNKLKVGTCYSSASGDGCVRRHIFDWLELNIGKYKALRCIRQYYREEKKIRIGYKEANRISCEFVSDVVNLVNSKYPHNGFYDLKREVVLTSRDGKRKIASKEYNGRAMTNGKTQISYAYFEFWNTEGNVPKDLKEDLLANVLLHEAGHHVFGLFTGMHIPNKKLRFVSYIDECFADLKCFWMMDKTGKEAADILRYKYDKVMRVKDNDECTKSHPSNNYRIQTLEKGVFSLETVREIADYINKTKGKGYITDSLVKEVSENIRTYCVEHPELELFFCLK